MLSRLARRGCGHLTGNEACLKKSKETWCTRRRRPTVRNPCRAFSSADASKADQCYGAWKHVFFKSRAAAEKHDWSELLLPPDARGFRALSSNGSIMSKIVTGQFPKESRHPLLHDYWMLSNLPEKDAHWNSQDPKWIGKSSMSARHKFVVPGVSHFGPDGRFAINAALMPATRSTLIRLDEMRAVALDYTEKQWRLDSQQVGLYFHCWPFSSVPYLHLHVVDLTKTGPSFDVHAHVNVPLWAVRRALCELIEGNH